ncbi:hypothetical protein VNO77_22977 [Canavalia gladiata]|uniref:Uncharacterized protein n=1 Tax=Canavalia gladiata TaxID=3824 RepID=A0AAN9QB34_CANGL
MRPGSGTRCTNHQAMLSSWVCYSCLVTLPATFSGMHLSLCDYVYLEGLGSKLAYVPTPVLYHVDFQDRVTHPFTRHFGSWTYMKYDLHALPKHLLAIA